MIFLAGSGEGMRQFDKVQTASQNNYPELEPVVNSLRVGNISTSPTLNAFCQDENQVELVSFHIILLLLGMLHHPSLSEFKDKSIIR